MLGSIEILPNGVKFILPQFPTHIKTAEKQRAKKEKKLFYDEATHTVSSEIQVINSSKVGKPKFEKINGQKFYNGGWNEFTKGKIVAEVKEYLYQNLPKPFPVLKNYPYISYGIMHIIPEFGYVSMRNGELKIPQNKTKSNWDIGNQGMFWSKVFDDFLQEHGIITEDTVNEIVGTGFFYKPVEKFEDRKLEFYLVNPPLNLNL